MKILKLLYETAYYIENTDKIKPYLSKISDLSGRPVSDLMPIWDEAETIAREQGKVEDFEFIKELFNSLAGYNESVIQDMLEMDAGGLSGHVPDRMIGKPVQPNKKDDENEQGINSLDDEEEED